MGMHPEGAAEAQWKVVIGAGPRRDGRPGDSGNAILLPWRGEAMPMDQARLVDFVLQTHPEALPHLGSDPEGAVELPDAENRCRLAVHLDTAPLDPQHRRRKLVRALRARKRGSAPASADRNARRESMT